MQEHTVHTFDWCQSGELEQNEKIAADKNQVLRRRFWEEDQSFKCPVVGMCLSSAEGKQLLKKAGYSFKGKSPFEIHEVLVAVLTDTRSLPWVRQ